MSAEIFTTTVPHPLVRAGFATAATTTSLCTLLDGLAGGSLSHTDDAPTTRNASRQCWFIVDLTYRLIERVGPWLRWRMCPLQHRAPIDPRLTPLSHSVSEARRWPSTPLGG